MGPHHKAETMTEQHDDWNPKDASILKDQRRAYDQMRERCPVAYSRFMGWSIFRHQDITGVLADPQTFSNASPFPAIPNGMDPPEHGIYRDALVPFFSEERLAGLEPQARQIAVSLLGPLLSGGEAEYVDAFATPFALRTLCAFLGWPDDQWKILAGWVRDSQRAAFHEDPAAGKALAELFTEHVKANLDMHRASPSRVTDATDALLRTEVNGEKLTDEQIVSSLRNWIAGHGTVVAGLGILVLHLAEDLELQGRLRGEPSLIPAVIEEILRVDGPLVANRRTTTRDVVIQGRSIPKGEKLALMWIAADRDQRAFDDPVAVKIERSTGDGLVWGQGIHDCMGAPLARLEMRIGIEELLSRTKRVELTGNAPIRAVYPGNGFDAFHLRIS